MKVLIVDDEMFIRDGLRTLIDWSEAGFDEVRDAKNAAEAMELISQSPPDMVLTDIFMPGISGLDFAKRIRSLYPNIRFVILTGYEKFEYAKEAIEIGVAKYLVKPIFPDELKETVEELRDEMLLEHRNQNWNEMAQMRLNEYKPIITEKFWSDVLSGGLATSSTIHDRAEMADIQLKYSAFCCLAVETCHLENVFERYGERELPLVRFAIRNIIEELHLNTIVYVYDHSDTVMLCILSEATNIEVWRRSVEMIKATLKIDVNVGVGRSCENISSVWTSSLEALDSVKYLAMLEQTGVIRYEDIPVWKKDRVEYPYEEEKMLLEILRYRDQISEQAIAPFMQKIMIQNPSPQIIQLTCVQLLGAVYRLVDEYGIHSIPTFNQSVSKLDELSSYSQIQKLFFELFMEIIGRRSNHHASFVNQLVDGAKQIIQARFHDPELSVASIAQILCISPNYLSRIFHQQIGKTCVEFITECRLEEAKKLLLLTNYKNYEIAEKVGYANAHYFSSMFKKNIGQAPSEFRERSNEEQS
ncbi:response regulator transcription factor [Paenibacillus sp. sgz302251]|uniref:response regulator transcription factor n=1 Tax=Paenibacillus sp. sgz302251 TaxID=3414493 RepID=UPI003C7D3955